MVDTYRTGSSQEDTGSQSYRTAQSRATYPTHDAARRYDRRSDYNERRGNRIGNLLLEDSIVLLGILVGGAAGYMAATTVRGSKWSGSRTRRSFESAGMDRHSSR